MSKELKERARQIIECLAKLDQSKRPGGGVHGQVIGMEPYVIRTNGDGLQCLYDAQSLLDELLDPFDHRPAPQVALTDALPELPRPARIEAIQFCDDGLYFTDDQMRQYAQQCIEARNQQGDAGALEMACVVNKKLGDVLAGRLYLLPHDLAALKRFYECATDFDSGGHDVSKDAMARLREIGVVQSKGFGRHETTSFGDYVLARDEGDPVKLPLKTLTERNADAAIEQRKADKKGDA